MSTRVEIYVDDADREQHPADPWFAVVKVNGEPLRNTGASGATVESAVTKAAGRLSAHYPEMNR